MAVEKEERKVEEEKMDNEENVEGYENATETKKLPILDDGVSTGIATTLFPRDGKNIYLINLFLYLFI